MKYLKFLISVFIIFMLVIFLVENQHAFSTSVQFVLDLFSIHYKSPLLNIYSIAGISFLIGIIIAGLFGIAEWFRLKRQIKGLIKASKEKDRELNSLRNPPIIPDNVGSKKSNI